MLTTALNVAWYLSNLPGYWKLKQHLANPGARQRRLLKRLLQSNAGTVFGQRYGFSDIQHARDYQSRVPIHQYDDLVPMIEDIKLGKPNVLTRESVTHLMPSSGSTSACKLIPYTRSLQREFDQAIAAWIVNLYIRHPRLMSGRAYWSITPYVEEVGQRSAVPIGFKPDSAYLGGIKKHLVEPLMAVRADIAQIENIELFRYLTLLELLRCSDLRLISVWHPSFLTLLMDELTRIWESLLRDVNDGTVNPPVALPNSIKNKFAAKPDKNRCIQLSRACGNDGSAIWPDLEMISCWGSGHARGAIKELDRYFPGVNIQQKGLIATEAFMSLPFGEDEYDHWLHPLAINSHFFEFIDANGDVKLIDQLQQGEAYQIIVTTGGGLYRYAMNDRIRVNGFVDRTPSIEFVGKHDSVSDYCGEKLNDQFVADVIDSVVAALPGNVTFAMLAPDGGSKPDRYTLYLEIDSRPDISLSEGLDEKLCRNPHYAECRRLGQLKKVQVFNISHSANHAYVLSSMSQGKRLGDVKPIKLSNRPGWSSIFSGNYIVS